MPRPNQPRSIASESALARRVAHERESRGMSYEGLASRMTQAGCPIQASGLYKIEKGDPPRRITVDELVAFAQVFGVPIPNLLLPPEMAAREELADLAIAWSDAEIAAWSARDDAAEAWEKLRTYVQSHEDLRGPTEAIMNAWVELWPEDQRPAAYADKMSRLTGDESYMRRLIEGTPWALEAQDGV